jgi:hypothetical protein
LKKTHQVVSILICILAMLSCFVVTATLLPPSPQETQGISTSTVVSSEGFLSHTSSMQWALSNEAVGLNVGIVDPTTDPPEWGIFPEPPLNIERGEVQMYCVYSEETDASNGAIEYTRSTDIDTSPSERGVSNVENDRLINFVGDTGGRIVSTEDLVLDTVGTPINVEYGTLCPFVDLSRNCAPAFCNLAETGSLIDMSMISASSASSLRTVNPPGESGHTPTLPSVGYPALADYSIRITELTDGVPSEGLVSTYMDSILLEGSGGCSGRPIVAQRISMEEYRSVEGDVSLFEYVVGYESGLVR